MRQLPLYDQDPSQCCGLAEGELKLMEDFVKKYKAEALGVGEVALPGQGGSGKEEGKPQDKSIAAGKPPESTNGALESMPAGGHYVSAVLRNSGMGWQGCPGSALSLGSFQGTDSVSAREGRKKIQSQLEGENDCTSQGYLFLVHNTVPVGFSKSAAVLFQTTGAVLRCSVALWRALVQPCERPWWDPLCAPASPAGHKYPLTGRRSGLSPPSPSLSSKSCAEPPR